MVKEQPTQTNWDKRKEDKKSYFKNELYNFSLELHLKFNEIFPKEQAPKSRTHTQTLPGVSTRLKSPEQEDRL